MSRIVTHAEFLARARAVHGDRYDYGKSVYTGANAKLTIICREHGPFEQAPSNHYAGKGCRACAGLQPYTLASFVKKARAVHGDKYDYSRVVLGNVLQKVTIRCLLHGDFDQTPSKHMGGSACAHCGTQRTADKQRASLETFLKKARVVHGEKYDYSAVQYVSTHQNVTIACRVHGPFLQSPAAHLRGAGCPVCAGKGLDTNGFVARARALHGERFSYDRAVYRDATAKITVTCPDHGDFDVLPGVHVRQNGSGGCKPCRNEWLSRRFARGNDGFIAKARIVHGDKYEYSQVRYVNKESNVLITCPKHGAFEQRGGVHLAGGECPACSYVSRAEKIRLTQEEFIARARAVHGEFYDYSQVVYIGTNAYVTVVCPIHGSFEQNAHSHKSGTGCPGCAEHGFDPNQPAVLYILAISGRACAFTGFGITRDINTRLRAHRKNLASFGLKIVRQHVVDFKHGCDALALEMLIKQKFDLVPQSIDGFRTEATHERHFDDLLTLFEDLLL